MKYRPIFIMGTSSGAGKTITVTALCRIFRQMGIDVVPFKAQNMSLNAGVGIGGEMAYAQIIQAMACGVEPMVEMNPVLLKPESNKTHIVVLGKHRNTVDAKYYMNSRKTYLMNRVMESFRKLESHELIILEGAGSPAEINIKNDIANYRLAKKINSKNILVSDIDRGGSFASIIGTIKILGKGSFDGYILNKFRGREELLYDAYTTLEEKYGLIHYGTVPFMDVKIPQEDSMWSWREKSGKLKISVIKLPTIANVTDFNVFYFIDNVGLRFATKPEELDGSDIIIIPGTKLTVPDLLFLRREGFENKLNELKKDAIIMGICGGYQMMGKYIHDDVESGLGKVEGLNLLDSRTKFLKRKRVARIEGKIITGPFSRDKISGYEIHMGVSDSKHPFSIINKENGKDTIRYDGALENNIIGTYFHDIFNNASFTNSLLEYVSKDRGYDIVFSYNLEKEIDRIAEEFKRYIKYKEMLGE